MVGVEASDATAGGRDPNKVDVPPANQSRPVAHDGMETCPGRTSQHFRSTYYGISRGDIVERCRRTRLQTLGTAIGVPLTAAEPRITAAIFGGGFFAHEALIEAARRITVPIQFLLPWDDEHVDRRSALALFDAFATEEKTLHANLGDHRSIRWIGVDNEFLPRHLGRAPA
jgi:hypothetical protein